MTIVLILLELPFGREDPFDTGVQLAGLIKGPSEGLVDRFDDVMQVVAVGEVDVDIGPGMVAKGDEKLLDQLGIEISHLGLGHVDVEDKEGSYNFV